MKKKAEGMSLRETFAIHRRAARDMRRIAPGCFMPFILCAVVEAASPYAVIWLSARLVDELSTLRRPEILAKWVLWIVAVSAAAELLKAVLERWKNVRSELLDRQKEVLYTEKFLRMDYADCDRQETRDLFSQIRQNAAWSGWGFAHLKLYYTQAVQGITGILGAAALTVSLFTRQVPTSAGKLTALNHPLFLVGILLGYIATKHDSIIPCIVVHFTINSYSMLTSLLNEFDQELANVFSGLTAIIILVGGAVLFVYTLIKERLPDNTPRQSLRCGRIAIGAWPLVLTAAIHIGAALLYMNVN